METIKIKNTTVTKANFTKWVQALRSGKYSQTTNKLQDSNGFCCLGVACKLFIPPNEIEFNSSGFLLGSMPDFQSESPRWLKDVSEDFLTKTNTSLAQLNDGGFTFDEIADLIEAVYLERVLDVET